MTDMTESGQKKVEKVGLVRVATLYSGECEET
jgi:hypothetical protein